MPNIICDTGLASAAASPSVIIEVRLEALALVILLFALG
jgi:hypothetical protein